MDDSTQYINNQKDMSLITRHARLSQIVYTIVDDASLTNETTSFILNEFELLHGKIKEMIGGRSALLELISKKCSKESINIHNPSNVRSKGC